MKIDYNHCMACGKSTPHGFGHQFAIKDIAVGRHDQGVRRTCGVCCSLLIRNTPRPEVTGIYKSEWDAFLDFPQVKARKARLILQGEI